MAIRLGIGNRKRGSGAVLGHAERLQLLDALRQARGAARAVSPTRSFPVASVDAIAVGAAAALRTDDRLCAPAHYLAAHIARGPGEPPTLGFATEAADLAAVAAGVALALSRAGSDAVTLALLDDSAVAGHAWRELVAQAADSLALVLVVDCAGDDVVPGHDAPVDGLDVEAVLAATRVAVEEARAERSLRVVSSLRPAAGLDPLRAYIRQLRAIGFPRGEIEAAGRLVGGGLLP